MRITPRTLVVDCGAAHVAVAQFASDRGGRLELMALAVEVHATEPGADARWVSQVAEALAAATARVRWRGPCRVALPGHRALAKLGAAPGCDPAQRRSARTQAVAQSAPFALEELTWDAHELPGNGPEADLVLAAAKTEWMDDVGAALVAARLEPTGAEPAALALVRAYYYNYADATAPAVIVDLGARSTSILGVAPEGRFFLRTVPLGGNAITQALAEKLGVGFTAAEARKRQWLDRTDDVPRDLEFDAVVLNAAEHWIQRLAFEIGRTLSGPMGGGKFPAPGRVLLTGGGSSWPGLAQRLGTELGLAVEGYDGTRRVAVLSTVDSAALAAQGHHLPILVGLAATRLGIGPATLNLLTPGLQARHRWRCRLPWILAAAAAMTLVCAGAAWRAGKAVNHTRRELATTAAGIASLRQHAAVEAAAEDELRRLHRENEQLRQWLENRGAWAAWLGELQARLAAHGEVWLDHIRLKPTAVGSGSDSQHIELGGWLLDLSHPLAPPGPAALVRLQAVLTDLAAMPQVAALEDEHHDRTHPGRLGFGCTVVLAPDHRL